jgi:hypothetical protein
MDDFTQFHDEIRFVNKDIMVGKYFSDAQPASLPLFGPDSLGVFQRETDANGKARFGFYYWLRRSALTDTPTASFLRPLLDVRLPEGLGVTFDEDMKGFYFDGFTPPADGAGDKQIEAKAPAEGMGISLEMKITARDLNEFIEGWDHEARIDGTIRFANFNKQGMMICTINGPKSYFNYLRVNPATGEAEMLYRIYFFAGPGKEYLFRGRKYLQKDGRGAAAGPREIVRDFTTLYGRLIEVATGKEIGSALMKFRTFEDADAILSFGDFLKSFNVIGSDDPFVQARGMLRFMALTNQFVVREYDPAGGLFS